MLKQFACDRDFYDDRNSAPSQEKTASTLRMHSSPCLPSFPDFVFCFCEFFAIVMGD